MKLGALILVSGLALLPSLTEAQTPRYHVEFLGTFFPGRISENGEIIGTTSVSGNQRGYVTSSGHPLQLLPLPDGMISSNAIDVNEQGVIVGAVSPYYTPEFSGRAVAWDPDGVGGFTVRLLGELPGQALSRAAAVNNAGDIVGYSSNGTYRYPVLFTAPGGVMDLTSTGVFDPVDINDRRVLVDRSFTVKRLDLNTMIVEDLGTPPGSYLATSAAAINEAGQVGGNAILTGGGNCDRVAARYTDGVGWQIFSGCGQGNGVSDMNEQGDAVMYLNVAPYVRFEGLGTFLVEDLIVNDIGHWYVSNYSGVTINSARWIAVFATNQVTGQSGALLLTPESGADVDLPVATVSPAVLGLSTEPNPFGPMTGIRYDLPRGARVSLVVLDATGRVVRRMADGEMRAAGSHRLQWDGRDEGGRELASGAYRLRLDADGVVRIGHVVLLR
jgi:hypothetical protein